MKRSEFENLLCAAGALSSEHEFIVFGSQALLGYIENPPAGLLVSLELDLYPKNEPGVVRLIEAALGRNSEFARQNAYYADYATPDVATWPDGWANRLIRFEKSGIVAWCAELHDVAISKLAVARPKDIRYLKILLRHKMVSERTLRERIELVPNSSTRERLNKELDPLMRRARRAAKAKHTKPRHRKS